MQQVCHDSSISMTVLLLLSSINLSALKLHMVTDQIGTTKRVVGTPVKLSYGQ